MDKTILDLFDHYYLQNLCQQPLKSFKTVIDPDLLVNNVEVNLLFLR